MARITALLLAICAALALGTSTARAGAWQFVETSCTDFLTHNGCVNNPLPGPGTPITLPQVIGGSAARTKPAPTSLSVTAGVRQPSVAIATSLFNGGDAEPTTTDCTLP